MTRWARGNNVHRHKAAEATPWSQLRGGGAAGAGGGAAGGAAGAGGGAAGAAGGPRSSVQKPRRRKKEFTNEDVNGFLDFLQQSCGGVEEAGGRRGERQTLRQEVEEALRKDGRREHRRLKRQKKKKDHMLCFLCRGAGHGLADCPRAHPDPDRDRDPDRDPDQDPGSGICYRCGSTEHEAGSCRAKLDPAAGPFPFARCFSCSQTGHLSRSCPQNPRGLYDTGGSCRLCGSVEHFQRDCPQNQASGPSLTLGWLSNNMSADYQDVLVPEKKKTTVKKIKVVKF